MTTELEEAAPLEESQTAEIMIQTLVKPTVAVPPLIVSHDPAINYAFQQTAIPVGKKLRFQSGVVARKDLFILVTAEPAFAALAEIRQHGVATTRNRQPLGIAA